MQTKAVRFNSTNATVNRRVPARCPYVLVTVDDNFVIPPSVPYRCRCSAPILPCQNHLHIVAQRHGTGLRCSCIVECRTDGYAIVGHHLSDQPKNQIASGACALDRWYFSRVALPTRFGQEQTTMVVVIIGVAILFNGRNSCSIFRGGDMVV